MSGTRPAPKAKNDLRIGEIDFISLCAAGDNPGAEVVIAKAWNPGANSDSSNVNSMTTNANDSGGVDLQEVLKAALANVERLEEQNAILAKMLEDELDDEYEDDEYFDDDEDFEKDLEDDEYDEDDFDDEDLEYEEYDEDFEDEDLDDRELVAKRLDEDPIMKELFAAQQAQIRELEARAAEADSIAKAERETRLLEAFTNRAASLEPLGEDPRELGYDMRELFAKVDLDSYKRWEDRMVRWAAAIDEGALFDEVGVAGFQVDPTNSYDDVMAKVKGQASGDMTPEQLFVKQLYENPSLYSEMTNGSMR